MHKGQAVCLGLRWALHRRAHAECRITKITYSQVIYYKVPKGRSDAPGLWRLSRGVGSLYHARNWRIETIWVVSEKHSAGALLRWFQNVLHSAKGWTRSNYNNNCRQVLGFTTNKKSPFWDQSELTEWYCATHNMCSTAQVGTWEVR